VVSIFNQTIEQSLISDIKNDQEELGIAIKIIEAKFESYELLHKALKAEVHTLKELLNNQYEKK